MADMKKPPLLLSMLMLSPLAQASVVYKCVGENGRIHYQSAACSGAILPIDEYQPPTLLTPSSKQRPTLSTPSVGGSQRRVRSEAKKNSFKSIKPCPSNGEDHGPCPGYVIDHIKPLACGGADDPGNMQWQTVEEGKAKDAWERAGCQSTTHAHLGKHSHRQPRLPRLDDIGAILLRTP